MDSQPTSQSTISQQPSPLPAGSSLAQFTLGSHSITTTVVTTTTTQTTKFPPIVIPPLHSNSSGVDLSSFPLATAETPDILENFAFELGGVPFEFKELKSKQEVEREYNTPLGSKTVKTTSLKNTSSHPAPQLQHHHPQHHTQHQSYVDSLSASTRKVSKRKRSSDSDGETSMLSSFSTSSSSGAIPQAPHEAASLRSSTLGHHDRLGASSTSYRGVDVSTAPRSHKRHVSTGSMGQPDSHAIPTWTHSPAPLGQHAALGQRYTPAVKVSGGSPSEDVKSPSSDSNWPHSPTLPSPTLSPTTIRTLPEDFQPPVSSHSLAASSQPLSGKLPQPASASLLDIPYVVSLYDTLPHELQSYLLFQLLKRSQMPVLRFVSTVIQPTFKRDFFGLLPAEISYQIMGYLDLRTMGRCCRVSKRWKAVLDGPGAERAVWKRRLMDELWYNEEEIQSEVRKHRLERLMEIKERKARKGKSVAINSDSADGMEVELPLGSTALSPDVNDDLMVDVVEHKGVAPTTSQHPTRFSDTPVSPVVDSDELEADGPADLPPGLYKRLNRRHHTIRQNWLHGRYKQISFPAHETSVVTCLQFDTDKIVSGSDDQTMHIYDTKTGNMVRRLSGHDGGVWALQYWKHVLVSGSTDRSVRVWDMDSGQCTHIFEGHTSTVRCLTILTPSPVNGDESNIQPAVPLIVTGSRDATLRVWRLPDPKVDPPHLPEAHANGAAAATTNPYFMHVLTGHSGSVRAIAGYGNILVSGSYDSSVRVWDVVQGRQIWHFTGHREKVYSVGYSHELQRAVSGSMDASVRVWCTKTGAALFSLERHASLVGLLELSPSYVVSAAADSTLRIWSPLTGECLATLTGHSAAITCFHHDPKLNRIVSGSDGGVKVWELSSAGPSARGESSSPKKDGAASNPSNGPFSEDRVVHGRFIRDLISDVAGVWRVRMDERRLVCAVQKDQQRTWFEVLDFDEGITPGEKVEGMGDRHSESAPDDETGDDDDDHDGDADGGSVGENDGDHGGHGGGGGLAAGPPSAHAHAHAHTHTHVHGSGLAARNAALLNQLDRPMRRITRGMPLHGDPNAEPSASGSSPVQPSAAPQSAPSANSAYGTFIAHPAHAAAANIRRPRTSYGPHGSAKLNAMFGQPLLMPMRPPNAAHDASMQEWTLRALSVPDGASSRQTAAGGSSAAAHQSAAGPSGLSDATAANPTDSSSLWHAAMGQHAQEMAQFMTASRRGTPSARSGIPIAEGHASIHKRFNGSASHAKAASTQGSAGVSPFPGQTSDATAAMSSASFLASQFLHQTSGSRSRRSRHAHQSEPVSTPSNVADDPMVGAESSPFDHIGSEEADTSALDSPRAMSEDPTQPPRTSGGHGGTASRLYPSRPSSAARGSASSTPTQQNDSSYIATSHNTAASPIQVLDTDDEEPEAEA